MRDFRYGIEVVCIGDVRLAAQLGVLTYFMKSN